MENCIWMQSEVVKIKRCDNDYDCMTCKYDKAMTKKVLKGKTITWQNSMRKRGGMDRTCRHTLTNRIDNRKCALNYQCGSCEFDQIFEDVMVWQR